MGATELAAEVQAYVERMPSQHRPLFDRVHRLILEAAPGAEVSFAYNMPTYTRGGHRIHVAAWRHGISLYGLLHQGDPLLAQHPELRTSTGTVRIRQQDAAAITDDELRGSIRGALPV